MNRPSDLESSSPNTADYYDAFARTGQYEADAEAVGWPAGIGVLVDKALTTQQGGTVDSMLDLGTGSGLVIEAVKRLADPARVTAVDASEKMLDLLRAKKFSGDVEIRHDAIQLFVERTDEQFDLITCLSAAEFVPRLPARLPQIARLLSPGGTLVFTYRPLYEGQWSEEYIDHTNKIGSAGVQVFYRVPATEVEEAITGSGLSLVEHARLADVQPIEGLDYNFVVAQKPAD
jgi:predicted TPR repeat methyltransferase